MKKLLIISAILFGCDGHSPDSIDTAHVENLAKDFMKTTVIPKMNDPKPYEVVDAKVVVKRVSDHINDYRFVYDHFSKNHFDSVENRKNLDSVIRASKHPESIISVTVNVGYRTRYQRGDVVLDSIKLKYDYKNDKISYWPF
ncbi:MAG: hypothetical protein ABI683_17070 [Ginsengibacter sp.]